MKNTTRRNKIKYLAESNGHNLSLIHIYPIKNFGKTTLSILIKHSRVQVYTFLRCLNVNRNEDGVKTVALGA